MVDLNHLIMKQNGYSVSIFFEKRVFKVGTNLNPLELTVNLPGAVQFRIRLKIYATKDDFEKAMKGSGGNNEVKELRKEINEYVSKAETILSKLPNPNKETFTRLFKSSTNLFTSNKTDITYFFEEKIRELKQEERFSTASTYELALKSFKKYSAATFFEDIDEKYLKGYLAWMKQLGNSNTTPGIYLRNLKAIFNKSIKDGFVSEKLYPFKDFKIGGVDKSKNVLYPEHIKKLWEYNTNGIGEKRAKALFFFCYMANGMNFKDVAHLRYSNINNDMICFIREKTKRTKTTPKQIKVYYRGELKNIVEEWGQKNNDKDEYIFPFLGTNKSAEIRNKSRIRWQRTINKKLRVIGKELGFDINLNLSLARHSFATRLKLDKVPISFISDAMGHSSTSTTEHYLKSIPDDLYKEMSNSLLRF